ncbi:MAG: hypothetical protein K1X29_02640 [Bdellovibrionales bacterium]|nr:hypothetical protein [Bdellovibrionales bacterium]
MNKTAILTAALTGLMMAGCASGTKATTDTSGAMAQGECHGVNSCKGTGECGGAGHSCAGKNSCKGQGWVKLSKKDCDTKGGTFKNM